VKDVILCGGMGTRLREETEVRPKPMVEIGHRPILWHIMKVYAHHGFRDFVLCLGYKGEAIRRYFLDYHTLYCDVTVDLGHPERLRFHDRHAEDDWSVTLADTGWDTMTSGRLWRVRRYLQEDDDFMLTYGDGVADVDLTALLAFHRSHGRVATVTGVRPSSRWGELVVEDDRVTDFLEKPQISAGYINGGFFVLGRKVFGYLEEGDPTIPFERAPMSRLTADGQLMVYRHHGYWMAMDTLRDRTLLNEEWKSEKPAWKVWS